MLIDSITRTVAYYNQLDPYFFTTPRKIIFVGCLFSFLDHRWYFALIKYNVTE